MLAIVDNQLATVNPILTTGVEYSLVAEEGRLVLYACGVPVESGVTFFRLSNHRRTTLDPCTGEFEITGNAPTKFRAVFGNQHIDLEIWP